MLSQRDVIGFMKSFYEARFIDVADLYEKSATRHVKVSRVHCRSRLGLPVLPLFKGS